MPAFRIIVTEHTRGPKTGNIVEQVGTYNPKTKEKQFDADRIKHWLSVGAKASATVHNMLISAKIVSGKKIVKHSEKPAEPVAEVKDAPSEGGSASGGKSEAKTAEAVPVAEEVPAEGGSALGGKAEEKTETAEAAVAQA